MLSNLLKLLLGEASAGQGRGSWTTLEKLRHNQKESNHDNLLQGKKTFNHIDELQ